MQKKGELVAWPDIYRHHDLDSFQRGQRNVDSPFANGEGVGLRTPVRHPDRLARRDLKVTDRPSIGIECVQVYGRQLDDVLDRGGAPVTGRDRATDGEHDREDQRHKVQKALGCHAGHPFP